MTSIFVESGINVCSINVFQIETDSLDFGTTM